MAYKISIGRKRNGFTLVEVMVTMIVLAIGILGLAGLQLAGMRSNYSAYQRTQAILAASDLIDRMRVSPADFAGAAYATSAAAEVAPFDRWAANLATLLPAPDEGAQGAVNCGNGNGCQSGNCEIIIRWNDGRAEDASVTQDGDRDAGSLTFRVCTRLPETS